MITSNTNNRKRSLQKERVKVVVRIRPPFEHESDSNLLIPNRENKHLLTVVSPNQDSMKNFYFDHVFDSNTTQEEIFESIGKPITKAVLSGKNGTVMAYGQTGTGKTFTMGILGDVDRKYQGLVPRCFTGIFKSIKSDHSYQWSCSLSFLQIYMENIQDLLNPGKQNLQLRESIEEGVYVENLSAVNVTSVTEAEEYVLQGLQNRIMAPTLMNTTSSRAHTVLSLRLNIEMGCKTRSSTLRMVDLAGSERVGKTRSSGERLNEAKLINKSLSALGNVISGLAKQNALHIPYRDSKLTRLLKGVLEGNSVTVMIATVSPCSSSYYETMSTLMFAQRCMHVRTNAVVNETDNQSYTLLIKHKLEEEIKQLRKDLQKQKDFILQHELNNSTDSLKEELNSDLEVAWNLVTALHSTLWDIYKYASRYSMMHAINDTTSSYIPEKREPQEFQNAEQFIKHVGMLQKSILQRIKTLSKQLEMKDGRLEELERKIQMYQRSTKFENNDTNLSLLNNTKFKKKKSKTGIENLRRLQNAVIILQRRFRKRRQIRKAKQRFMKPPNFKISQISRTTTPSISSTLLIDDDEEEFSQLDLFLKKRIK